MQLSVPFLFISSTSCFVILWSCSLFIGSNHSGHLCQGGIKTNDDMIMRTTIWTLADRIDATLFMKRHYISHWEIIEKYEIKVGCSINTKASWYDSITWYSHFPLQEMLVTFWSYIQPKLSSLKRQGIGVLGFLDLFQYKDRLIMTPPRIQWIDLFYIDTIRNWVVNSWIKDNTVRNIKKLSCPFCCT